MKQNGPLLSWRSFFILLALALWLGGIYRFADLGLRPMHTDEAILAVKTTELMQSGHFQYDPKDYHGPVLHYLARWVASLKHWTPETITEVNLRWIIALCGMVLIASVIFLIDALSKSGAVTAAFLIAFSPMMVYYNRYYIMETVFVLEMYLFVAFLWRWSQSGGTLWLLLAGVALGLMHATKETFILNVGALVVAWILVRVSGFNFSPKRSSDLFRRARPGLPDAAAVILVLLMAAFVSVAFYSAFFKDWSGVKASVMTYQSYFHRSGGSGHEKPWMYYLTTLFWHKDGFIWTEAMIGGLAVLGMLLGPALATSPPRRAFILLLSGYSLLSLALYSAIPYKTPWSILATQHALTLLAGLGFASLMRVSRGQILKGLWVMLFIAGLWHLGLERRRAVVQYPADPRNPYVYSHTSRSAVELAARVHELAALSPQGKQTPVRIISAEAWPLPWYLRDMPHVGYYREIPQKISDPLIILDAPMEDTVLSNIASANYVTQLFVLRPNYPILLFSDLDLWYKFLLQKDSHATRPEPLMGLGLPSAADPSHMAPLSPLPHPLSPDALTGVTKPVLNAVESPLRALPPAPVPGVPAPQVQPATYYFPPWPELFWSPPPPTPPLKGNASGNAGSSSPKAKPVTPKPKAEEPPAATPPATAAPAPLPQRPNPPPHH